MIIPDIAPELNDLALALGLFSADGSPNSDWFDPPGNGVTEALADDARREALVRFVEASIGEGEHIERNGITLLPLVSVAALTGGSGPDLRLLLSIDDRPVDHVAVGVVGAFTTAGGEATIDLTVPVYRARKRVGPTLRTPDEPFPLLDGEPIEFALEIALGDGTSDTSGFGLRAVGVAASVPVTAVENTTLRLELRGLQLPGASAPVDMVLGGTEDDLGDVLLGVVLGIVRASAASLGADGAAGRAALDLLGLGDDPALPPLDLDLLLRDGVAAVRDWFTETLGDPPSRSAWLGRLGELVGGDLSGEELRIPLPGPSPVSLHLALGVSVGADGHRRVTPRLRVSVETTGSPTVAAEAVIDLFTVSTFDGSLTAVPHAEVDMRLGDPADPLIPAGDVRVELARVGVSVNDGVVRPMIRLENCVVNGAEHPVLDLSNADAVEATVGNLASGLLVDAIEALGGAGVHIAGLIGLAPPTGVTAVDAARLLSDPLDAIGGWWQGLLRDHGDDVAGVLEHVRDLIATDSDALLPINGDGTPGDPWRIRLADRTAVDCWRDGDDFVVAPTVDFRVDTLGAGCTVMSTTARVELVRIDLAERSVSALRDVSLVAAARAKGASEARLSLGPVAIAADHLGLRASWKVDDGVDVRLDTPGLRGVVDGVDVALELPTRAADGTFDLSPESWTAVERLVAVLASTVSNGVLTGLVDSFGWTLDGSGPRRPLSLAAVADDPVAEIGRWVRDQVTDESNVVGVVTMLSQILTGSTGRGGALAGIGSAWDPLTLPLGLDAAAPALDFVFGPDGPARSPVGGHAIEDWRPGLPGFTPEALADAVAAEARANRSIADLASGRAHLASGLTALVSRLAGTDGLVAAPPGAIDGIEIIRDSTRSWDRWARLTTTEIFDEVLPDDHAVVRVAIGTAATAWPDAPPDRVIDLSAPGLSPESFAVATTASGDWFVALASRGDAALAAGDPDGLLGQSGRLHTILDAFDASGIEVALVAHSGAGHAARIVADGVSAVARLATLGTPWSPVAFETARSGPSADVARLLHSLLPDIDEDEPDDDQLALGRSLVDGLLGAAGRNHAVDVADLVASPPTIGARAGLRTRAWFGELDVEDIRAAITAVTAAGMWQRVVADAPDALAGALAANGAFTIPIDTDVTGLRVRGTISIGLIGADFDDGLASALASRPSIGLRLRVADSDGWLVGGPGTSPADDALPIDLREIEIAVTIAGDTGTADLVLIEGSAFGVPWDRLVVRPNVDVTGTLDEEPLLPEARAALAALVARLGGAADGTPGSLLRGLFDASGVSIPDLGFVPDALAHLLHDPVGFVGDLLGRADARTRFVESLVALVPGLSTTTDAITYSHPAATASIDLGSGRIDVQAAATAAGSAWSCRVDDIGGDAAVSATIGTTGPNSIQVRVASSPFAVDIARTTAAGADEVFALWPRPDTDRLWSLFSAMVGGEAARLVLEGVRGLDPAVEPVVAALAEALGVLAPVADDAPSARRPIVAPVALFAEGANWLRSTLVDVDSTGRLAKVTDLLDALKPFVGMSDSPSGRWDVATGVAITATAGPVGPRIGLDIDPGAWLGGTGRPPFVGRLGVDLAISTTGPPQPSVALVGGVPGDAGAAPSTVHVEFGAAPTSDSFSVFVRRPGQPDLDIFPNPSGLGALLTAGVQALLPRVLDAIAALDGDSQAIADFVAATGRGLAIATGGDTPGSDASFSATGLQVLAADPTGVFTARIVPLVEEVAGRLGDLVDQLPGATSAGTDAAGRLVIDIRDVVVAIDPSPLSITIAGSVDDLETIGTVTGSFSMDAGGVTAWSVGVGPAELDLAGPVLRPLLVANSDTSSGWTVDVGLGLDALGTRDLGHRELRARWRQGDALSLVSSIVEAGPGAGVVVTDRTDPGEVTTAAISAVIDVLGSWVLSLDDVSALIDRILDGGTTARELLSGSVLSVDGTAMRSGLVDDVPGSLFALSRQVASLLPAVDVGPFTLGLELRGDIVSLVVGIGDPAQGLPLSTGDVVLSLVADASWIDPPGGDAPAAGLAIDIVRVPATLGAPIEVAPGIAVNGLGLRVAGSSGPLLDSGIRLDAAELHGFGALRADGSRVAVSGGVRVELEGLAVPLGAGGGDNQVAQGIVADAGDSGRPPAPGFSPSLAVQTHDGGTGVAVDLSAGSGDGPWYVPIQRAFGPVFLDQIGLGAHYGNSSPRQLQAISISLDGSVSLLGLTASVDKLRLTYSVGEPIFDSGSWKVDVAGFAIASDVGGLTLIGGLRKFGDDTAPEYVGLLKIAFGGYGLSLFGGYAKPAGDQGTYASFFAFGALLAPIGGPPAFFITGIGLGFGINRRLELPTVENLDRNVFLAALRPSGPTPEPRQQLEQLQSTITPQQGTHWVAAGISFTSFVLVTGEVVVVVQFGDGLDIALLGLARVQLPGPAPAALVSIELALTARFSTKEGALVVRAQLTENSWLLDTSVRLTGGFAFATWWKGPLAGQFVVTIGGYHPRFSAPGYPTVPRLGINWSPSSNVVVKGETYFALCSEAIMAGISIEASARFGPAYARLAFGGDGIVFFDPFWFSVSAHAEVAAGIRIKIWFARITIEISLGVSVEVSGPPIYIEGRFKICGFTVPFEIGDRGRDEDHGLSADEFAAKYLRADDGAQPIQASVVKGALLPGRTADGETRKVGDGTQGLPFPLTPEFELTVLTTVPMTSFSVTNVFDPTDDVGPVTTAAAGLAVAPMKATLRKSELAMELHKTDTTDVAYSVEKIQLIRDQRASFPKGVWGPAQNRNAPSVPEGKLVYAEDRVTLRTTLADFEGAALIDYHQVETIEPRKPLPFVTDRAAADARRAAASALRAIADDLRPATVDERYFVAASLLSVDGSRRNTVAALRGERTATPTVASLADDLRAAPLPAAADTDPVVPRVEPQRLFVAPHVRSIMSAPAATAIPQATTTTVSAADIVRRPPPTLAGVRLRSAGATASDLIVRHVTPSTDASTVVADEIPVSRLATMPVAAVANARTTVDQRARLDTMTQGFVGGELRVAEGDLIVVAMGSEPGDGTDAVAVQGGPTRIIAIAPGGRVLDDIRLGDGDDVETAVPAGTERIVVVPIGALAAVGGNLAGWYAGQALPTVGWDLTIAGGATVRFHDNKATRNRERHDGGWANTAEVIHASRIVTRFDEAVTAVAVAIDDGPDDEIENLQISLIGAKRAVDDGAEREPVVLSEGVRSLLVYDVVPDGEADVSVVVDGARDIRVTGMVGAESDAAGLARRLAETPIESAVRVPLRAGGPARTIRWSTSREDT